MEELFEDSSITAGHLVSARSSTGGTGGGTLAPPSVEAEMDDSGGLGGSEAVSLEGSD